VLNIDKHGEQVEAPPEFMLVISYNPGYQSVLKEIKPSTRQRFVAFDFDYPSAAVEAKIVAAEGGVSEEIAQKLVKLGQMTRNLKGAGLDEGASTRLLVHAAQLIAAGVTPLAACSAAVARSLSDDPDMTASLQDLVNAVF
jgi:nitric oxide reductase NorQ protein